MDQEPVPQIVINRLEGAHTVIPYAQHGEAEFRRAGLTNVRYIPHGVVCSTFRPLDKAEARRTLGLPPDAFILGMVATIKGYPPRKFFPEQFAAFADFKKRHPDALLSCTR